MIRSLAFWITISIQLSHNLTEKFDVIFKLSDAKRKTYRTLACFGCLATLAYRPALEYIHQLLTYLIDICSEVSRRSFQDESIALYFHTVVALHLLHHSELDHT